MRKLTFVLVVGLALAVLWGCGGEKKLVGDFSKGMLLSYSPSLGKKMSYLKESIEATQFSAAGNTINKQTRSKSQFNYTATISKPDTFGVRIDFGKVERFEQGPGGLKKLEDEEKGTEGEYLEMVLTPDGKLIRYDGLTNVGYNDEGIDEGELTATDYAGSFIDQFPNKPVAIGETWKKETVIDVKTKKGTFKKGTKKEYTLMDFVERSGHKCAKVKTNITFNIEGKGEEEQDGKKYKAIFSGDGLGDGYLYFDFEQGIIVESMSNIKIDFEQNVVNLTENKDESMTFYQEQESNYKLEQK